MQAPKDGVAIEASLESALNPRALELRQEIPSGKDIFNIIVNIQMSE